LVSPFERTFLSASLPRPGVPGVPGVQREAAFARWVTVTDESLLDLELWLLADRNGPTGPFPFRPPTSGGRPLKRCG
jgi:hypothetical protein